MRKKHDRTDGQRLGLMKLAMLLLLSVVIVAGIIYFFDITPEQLDRVAENILITPRPTTFEQGASPTSPPIAPPTEPDADAVLPVQGKLSVVFLNVGNADCIFVQSPSGKTMLVDAGEASAFGVISDYLTRAGIARIDVLVATHPHNDHIGSMRRVVENYEIGAIYMPKVTHNTATYEKLLNAIKDKGMKIKTAKGGKDATIPFDGEVTVRILAPLRDEYSDLNDYSAVLRLDYNNSSFLLTGDIESVSEKDLLQEYPELLQTDVLKVPHHGSSSSSTPEFLSAVNPDYAVITCEKDSDYGHPAPEVLERLEAVGAVYYRTDLFGTIAFITDGNAFEIKTEYFSGE
jgi:competence protein ComEC